MTLAPPTEATRAAIHVGPRTVPGRTLGWTKEYLLQPDGPEAGEEELAWVRERIEREPP